MNFLDQLLGCDLARDSASLLRAGRAIDAKVVDGAVLLTAPLLSAESHAQPTGRTVNIIIRAYAGEVLRLTSVLDSLPADDASSPILCLHHSLTPEPLSLRKHDAGWDVLDGNNRLRATILRHCEKTPTPPDSLLWPESFSASLLPDAQTQIAFNDADYFSPRQLDSLPLCWLTGFEGPSKSSFSIKSRVGECFAGTGERFAKMDLAGQTLNLENTDGLGVNSRRTYKNVPFYISSRMYGLFIHTPCHARLSLADISTRSVIGAIDEPVIDLFFIAGGSVKRIVHNYCRITGFAEELPPLWSFGTWMSRMSYFTADETRTVARRMREGQFPCDVLHIDTGWFEIDWKCTWRFGKTFPEPEQFIREMRDEGFRITLWQMPRLSHDNPLYADAVAKGCIATNPAVAASATGSDFSGADSVDYIDFTNPAAVEWYQQMLANLLEMGVAAIKTDFGEDINMAARYHGMPAERLRNIYGLLYQRAAYEITKRIRGEGIIWARAGWSGCQRYPLHWGGDAASTWDGLAGTIRGGLHLGLSGFAFWSHDVPGFAGSPDFMNSRPDDELYVRWTQLGVFSSHLRYHGTNAREPYEFPVVADIVRKWLRLRYALIPYLLDQAQVAVAEGLPVLRAMIFENPGDRTCWNIDDQFYCGGSLLVAPIVTPGGRRDVYLPPGQWVDVCCGDVIDGPIWLRDVNVSLDRIPLYAKKDSRIRVYPHLVQCTDEMDLSQSVELVFDDRYAGLSQCILGEISGL